MTHYFPYVRDLVDMWRGIKRNSIKSIYIRVTYKDDLFVYSDVIEFDAKNGRFDEMCDVVDKVVKIWDKERRDKEEQELYDKYVELKKRFDK